MWEFQDRLAAKQKRLKRDARRRKRPQNDELHLYRVPIEIRMGRAGLGQPKVTFSGRLLSTELSSTHMEFFTTHRLQEGSTISITVLDGSRLYIRAVVQQCKRYRLNETIIQEFPHPYRVRVEFDFQSQQEAQTVAEYAVQFQETYVTGNRRAAND